MENKKKKAGGLRFGFRAKLLSMMLPFTALMVIILIVIAYTVSRSNIMDSSERLLATSAKDQSHQIESWLNRKLDEMKTVKFDIEQSGALTNDVLMQQKLDTYAGLDSAFSGGFYVSDLSGNVMQASDSGNSITSATGQIWFTEGITRMNPSFTKAYTDASGNQVISASGMLNDLENPRVISGNLSLDSINIIVNSSVSMPKAESLLIDKTDGTILVARDASLVSTSVNSASSAFLQKVSDKMQSGDYAVETLDKNVIVMREISGTNWILVSYIARAEITSEVDMLRNTLVLVAVICLLILCVVTYLTVAVAVKPLKDLTKKIQSMAEGDFTIHINPKGNDEIADIQRSVRSFVHRMREMINDINAITANIQNQADNSSMVSTDMQDSSEMQADSMSALNDTVDQFSISINEIAESATNLSGVVADTSADGDDVKEQIVSTVEMSKKGREDMQRVNEAMVEIRSSIEALVEAINRVGDASHEITGITALIANISEETSLLSLNASIEAARAGEAGRGFAVVATEISKLADMTANSADDIAKLVGEVDSLITAAVKQVDVSVTNINESGERINVAVHTFDEIYEGILGVENVISKVIDEIQVVNNVAMDVSAISEEQAASTTLISDTSEGMVEQANNLAKQSEQVADGAKILTQTSEELTRQMNKFKV